MAITHLISGGYLVDLAEGNHLNIIIKKMQNYQMEKDQMHGCQLSGRSYLESFPLTRLIRITPLPPLDP